MSAAPDSKNDDSSHSGDHDHHHAFDPEPTRVLPPDEARTPLWVPLAGIALFAAAGTWVLLMGGDEGREGQQKPVATQAAPPTPPNVPERPVTPPPQMRLPVPGASPSTPSVQRLSPEQAKALQERLEEMRNRGTTVRPPSPPPAPPPPAPGQ